MKTIYKVLLVVVGTIVFSELVHNIPTPAFIQKYIDEMDARNEANIVAMEKLGWQPSDLLPIELNVFKKSDDLIFNKTLKFFNRRPTAKFTYDKKYEITVYRIDTSYTQKLNTAVVESYENADYSINIYFANDNFGHIQVYYNNTNMFPKPKNIYFNLYGTNTQTVLKNDTIAYYNSNMTNAFVRYSANGPQDIYAKSYSDNSPIEILFLKRKNSLYFILMTAKDPKYSLPPNLLYNLTTGSN